MRWLSEQPIVGLDIDGTGLDGQRDLVRLVQFGDHQTGWVVPMNRWSGVVEDAVARYRGLYVGHGLPGYDCPMLRRAGIVIDPMRVHDTRLQAHVLSSTGSLALKKLAQQYIDPNANVGQRQLEDAMKSSGWTWATIPIDYEPYWIYAGLDPVLAFRLNEIQLPRVLADAPRSYDLELAASWVCERMERNAVAVDRDYCGATNERLRDFITQVNEWCRQYYNLSPGSDVAVADALVADGVPLHKRTDKTKRFSVDKDVLTEFAEHPLAQAVLRRRQALKLASTYFENYLRFSEYDGFIHPSINTVGGTSKNPFEPGGERGVRTSRMSCDSPNMQNVPIHTQDATLVRNAFISREGGVWIKCDFDQIEMRILAHEARDDEMIRAFKDVALTGDFFVNMARRIFADDTIVKSDPRRQPVKNAGYAKIYGAGIEQFARTAGMTDLAQAAAFLERFDQLYPGVRRWQREIEHEAKRTLAAEGVPYVRSRLTNRRLTADRHKTYALANYRIQGEAAELLKMKMVECAHAGLIDYMTLPVHDEVDLDVPKELYGDVVATLRDVMNDDSILDVPVTASISAGYRWGELQDVA